MPPVSRERWILHADMDAFFASVEIRDRPELVGQPVIVGGTSNRGVVSAASYEARKFGVRSAMPTFRAHKLCPQGIFLPGDMAKYQRVSRQIRDVFYEATDLIEPLALDEAFLDITGSVNLLGSPRSIGERIRSRVYEETKLRVSVGIAPNKLVAKIACSTGKPDGLVVVEPEEVGAFLAKLPIRRLWGVGPVAEKQLEALGIRCFGDLSRASPKHVALVFGERSEEMIARARGFDERPVSVERAPRSIGEESTFPDDVLDRTRLADAIVAHAEAVASRARHAGYQGAAVQLKVKLSRRRERAARYAGELYPVKTRVRTLPLPTQDASIIAALAKRLLDELALDEPVRLLGVALFQLSPKTRRQPTIEQLDLFSAPGDRHLEPVNPRSEQLGVVLDAINDRFGAGAVRRAVQTLEKQTAADKEKIGVTPSPHEQR